MTSKTPSTSSSSVSYTSEAATSTNKQMTDPPSGRDRGGGDDNENSQLPTSRNNAKFNRLCHNSRDKAKLNQQLFEHRQSESQDDHEEALCYEKQNPSNKQHRRKKILNIVIMTAMLVMALLAAALAVILLSDKIPKHQTDKCGDNHLINPRYSDFKLFGTKTSYSDALANAEKESLKIFEASNRFNKLSQSSNNYVSTSGVERYMRNVDTELRKNDCQLRQFHFYGRHAARYPSKKEIIDTNNLMKMVIGRIDLTKFSQTQLQTSTNSATTEHTDSLNKYPTNNSSNQSGSEIEQNQENKTVCVNPISEYLEWKSDLYEHQDDLILESGYKESSMIADRLKELYPIMFNGSLADIKVEVTDKIRTVQTALPFLRLIDNFNQDICSLNEFPTDTSTDVKAKKITDAPCYAKFMNNLGNPDLKFYKKCNEIGDTIYNSTIGLHDPARLNNIAQTLSNILKLDDAQDQLNSSLVEAIYRICKHETAQNGKSIWCRLFSEDDLKYLDFKEDIDDYFNQALYSRDLYESPCLIIQKIATELKSDMQRTNVNAKPKAFFHFAHAESIQRLLASITKGQLRSEDLTPKMASEYLRGPGSIKHLDWRSSTLSPFSANLAFSWYQCPDNKFKMVTALNERPIKIDNCDDVICSSDYLFDDKDPALSRQCKFKDICQGPHIRFN